MIQLLKSIIQSMGFYRLAFPPGHYASPIPDLQYILDNEETIFDITKEAKDIDLNAQVQFELLQKFKEIFAKHSYQTEQQQGLRYYFNNDMFQQTDGLVLYSIINHFRPQQIIEVGSGFSSAIMIDINENEFVDHPMKLTFIEPYPKRLNILLSDADKQNVEIIEGFIQHVPIAKFKVLTEGDILFLDSSHIIKTGSDISYWLFEVLPVLNQGVIIHIHDIFYPFEYPKAWITEQKCYTELYAIRAFLMNNNAYEVLFFNSFVTHQYKDWINENCPNDLKSQGGSLWLRKK